MSRYFRLKNLFHDDYQLPDSLWDAARGACLIEVNLDLELTGEDITDAINTPDEQLHLLFPALTPTDCLRLKKTLTEKRPQFEQVGQWTR